MKQIFVVNSQNVVYLVYCFYIGEKMMVFNKVFYLEEFIKVPFIFV